MSGDLAGRLHALQAALDARVITTSAYGEGLATLRREYGAAAVDSLLDAETPVASPAGRSATVTGQVGNLFLGDI